MSYALTREHLAAPFASLDHAAMQGLHDALVEAIVRCRRYEISTSSGTELRGELKSGERVTDQAMTPFSVPLVCSLRAMAMTSSAVSGSK